MAYIKDGKIKEIIKDIEEDIKDINSMIPEIEKSIYLFEILNNQLCEDGLDIVEDDEINELILSDIKEKAIEGLDKIECLINDIEDINTDQRNTISKGKKNNYINYLEEYRDELERFEEIDIYNFIYDNLSVEEKEIFQIKRKTFKKEKMEKENNIIIEIYNKNKGIMKQKDIRKQMEAELKLSKSTINKRIASLKESGMIK